MYAKVVYIDMYYINETKVNIYLKGSVNMTKVDIFSGFLGAGKTSLIKKLISEAYKDEQLVLIENEFGDIGVDGEFLKDSGIQVNEMNSGCICCSLVGDFGKALAEVVQKYHPDRILIEPSGVGKLSDVIMAVENLHNDELVLNGFTTVVDAKKCRMYMKNFGEFFNNQIQFANTIILSRTDLADDKKIEEAVALIKGVNPDATIVTTPLDKLSDEKIEEMLSKPIDLKSELLEELAKEHEHHHHHHDHDEHCEHERHHDHDEHCEHEHHHDHDEHCEHEHHHDHDEHCEHEHHHDHHDHCGCGHDHHDHHHADDVFDSWGMEQVPAISEDKLKSILDGFADEEKYGVVLRAKGMIKDANSDDWFYFDLVPGENDIRRGDAEYTGKVCVIGAGLKSEELKKCFRA